MGEGHNFFFNVYMDINVEQTKNFPNVNHMFSDVALFEDSYVLCKNYQQSIFM